MDRGIVVAYDADRGFGFIRSEAFKADVFVHVSAVRGRRALRVGQRVEFDAEVADRGPRATRVDPGRRGLAPGLAAGLGLVATVAGVMIALSFEGMRWPLAWLVAINPATAAVYAWDKHRALREARRVPEAVLLGLALIGGSPAAALTMIGLHHKTRKRSFLIPFAGVLVIQAILIVVAWRGWK
jgi:uncharacterized membrane protein YsdA (DUF1294 family)/cold shock CspA family protein